MTARKFTAITLLEEQHEEVDALFAKAQAAKGKAKQRAFERVADALAIHTTIEEEIFYPGVKRKATQDMLFEALEEHLGVKRVLADLMAISVDEETFDAKLKVLKEQVTHHVEEEEKELFPAIVKLIDGAELVALGEEMLGRANELEQNGDARHALRQDTTSPARI